LFWISSYIRKGIINLIKNAISERTEEMGDADIGIIDFLRWAPQHLQTAIVATIRTIIATGNPTIFGADAAIIIETVIILKLN
jgi:hypothetical protein